MNAKSRLAFVQEITLPCLVSFPRFLCLWFLMSKHITLVVFFKASVPLTAQDTGTAVCYTEYVSNAPINVKPAGGGGPGMGGGFDCLFCPWGRAFDWSCSPRGRDIWIFLRPTWRYLTADSDEKDWDRTYVSRFHASRIRHTVCKDQEVMEANENKWRLSGFHCFVFKFRLF